MRSFFVVNHGLLVKKKTGKSFPCELNLQRVIAQIQEETNIFHAAIFFESLLEKSGSFSANLKKIKTRLSRFQQ